MLKKLTNFNESLWTSHVSPKAYDVVRIALALAALANLIDLWTMREHLFHTDGLIDKEVLLGNIGNEPYFSFLHYTNTLFQVDLFFGISALACVCLALGFCTRLSALAVFAFHVSYGNYAFIAMHGWDVILRIFSFLILVSPIGHSWSLDNLIRSRLGRKQKAQVMNYGLTLMRLQVFVIYFETFWLKVANEFWRNGEFIGYFMLSSYSRFPFSFWAELETISTLLTYGTLVFEGSIGFLLWNPNTRKRAISAAAVFHIGLAVSGYFVLFSMTMLAALLAFSRLDKQGPAAIDTN